MAGNGCFVLNKVKVNDKTAMIRTENPFPCQRNMINMTHCSECKSLTQHVHRGKFTGKMPLRNACESWLGIKPV